MILKFLEIIYEADIQLIDFNLNVSESTSRTFMHILLEKGLINTFETISKLYGDKLDLSGKDMFENSALVNFVSLLFLDGL